MMLFEGALRTTKLFFMLDKLVLTGWVETGMPLVFADLPTR